MVIFVRVITNNSVKGMAADVGTPSILITSNFQLHTSFTTRVETGVPYQHYMLDPFSCLILNTFALQSD